MELRALHQFGVGERDADAAAKIAGDVDERRAFVGFLRRQARIGDRIDRYEQERHSDRLKHPHGREIAEARVGTSDVEYHIANAMMVKPMAIQYFGSIRGISCPIIGIMTAASPHRPASWQARTASPCTESSSASAAA